MGKTITSSTQARAARNAAAFIGAVGGGGGERIDGVGGGAREVKCCARSAGATGGLRPTNL